MGRLAPMLLLVLAGASGGCRCGSPTDAPPVRVVIEGPRTLFRLGRKVRCAQANRAGMLVAGTATGQVLVWREGGKPITVEQEGVHDGPLTQVQLSSDGKLLLSTGGHVAAVWRVVYTGAGDPERGELLRKVQGPQPITCGVLLGSSEAMFGTSQGHVMRWEVNTPRAVGVRGLSCGGTRVPPARMQLKPGQRCPLGVYVEPDEGPPACLYPVTHLVLLTQPRGRAGQVACACRTGEAAVMDRATRRLTFFSPGHLATLTQVGDDLLLGRADGKLRLYDLGVREVLRALTPAGAPQASASDGTLIAVVQGATLRIWHHDHPAALAAVRLPGPAVWVDLGPGRATVLLLDGQLLRYGLKVTRTSV